MSRDLKEGWVKAEKKENLKPEERHEQSDVPLRPLIAVFAVLGLLSVLTLVGLWALFVHFTGERVAFRSARIDTGIEGENEAPPPRLQDSPAAEMAAWDAEELEELNRLGWVDKEKGIVKVPIERAFDFLIAREKDESVKPALTPLELRQRRAGGKEEK